MGTQSAVVVEGKEPLVRLTLCFKKKQGISDEELLESWDKVGHGPLSSLLKAKSIKYNQFRLSAEWKEQCSFIPKEDWLDSDGATDLLARDVESITSIFHDPSYVDEVKPEQDKFMDGRDVVPMIGYNSVKYEKPLEKSTGSTEEEGKRPLVRLALCFKKNPNRTMEWADKHWHEVHAPLFASLPIVKEKLIKYNQFHFSSHGREQFKVQNAQNWTDFLGVAEFWATDVQSFVDVFTHEDYFNIIGPDEDKFVERGTLKALIGYDFTP